MTDGDFDMQRRLSAVETELATMRNLPERVAICAQEVATLKENVQLQFTHYKTWVAEQYTNIREFLTRELDGIRSQQKAHQEQTNNALSTLSNSLNSLQTDVSKIGKLFAAQKQWGRVLTIIGQLAVGIAVIAEAVKTVHG